MANKNGLSFQTRLWLCVFAILVVIIVSVVCFEIYSLGSLMEPTERGMIIGAIIISIGMVVTSGIIAWAICRVFGKKP